ncbi:putative F-box/LRR-repeat protein 9 [Silene latifolia]|uniref:putative F-box/LRR-repeat protein 9 n=1 Tax=Silene latifolia TaxID=37657 RepID=UPI003D77B8B5
MSSISNPNSSSINQPNSKKHKTDLITHQTNKTQFPNWLQLLEDIWIVIFSKLTTIEIIENVQKVCMLFRKICKQPSVFKTIDMSLPHGQSTNNVPYNLHFMTRYAVDCSAGGLADIYMEYLCDDDIFMYIIDRCRNLKHLRLGHEVYVSDEKLIEAVYKLPMLEEIQVKINSFSDETVEAIGHACPSLISFSLNGDGSKKADYVYNGEALAISKSMPKLRHLQLIGNGMDNVGLKAILDGCPHLEFLDMRACSYINLSGDLGKRIEANKRLICLYDSAAKYNRGTCSDEDDYEDVLEPNHERKP